MMDIAASSEEEQRQLILTSLPPSPVQKRMALILVGVLFVCFFIIAVPLSNVQLLRIDSFIPAYGAATFMTDSITAFLLFAQFAIVPSFAFLAIASGYMYMAALVIPWLLTFPEVFSRSGLLDAGTQSTAWLYMLWHGGFPLFVIAYALLKDGDPERSSKSDVWRPIVWAVTLIGGFVTVVSIAVTSGNSHLAALMLNGVSFSREWYYAAAVVGLLNLTALVVLWMRRHSVLDLWLMVVMCAYMIEISMITAPNPARYSIGWYGDRAFDFIASSLILFVLLYEVTTLNGRLLHAVLGQRREREARLVTGDAVSATVAHEVRQPLAAMTTRAAAGYRWLDRPAPDIHEAKEALKQIIEDGYRAEAVIEGIRANFRRDPGRRRLTRINELIGETLALLRDRLQQHRIALHIDLDTEAPTILGDPRQLQEVLLNLIGNAIESMMTIAGPRLLQMRTRIDQRGDAVVSVQDNGAGIDAQSAGRVFQTPFTTKADGMGMGLYICRSIIEAHGGRIWIEPIPSRGAVFEFALPIRDGVEEGPS
jgi:signal transduction histidine kinase